MNNLDPEVAERPDDLVVYGGTGRAARSWEAFDAIVDTLRDLEEDESRPLPAPRPDHFDAVTRSAVSLRGQAFVTTSAVPWSRSLALRRSASLEVGGLSGLSTSTVSTSLSMPAMASACLPGFGISTNRSSARPVCAAAPIPRCGTPITPHHAPLAEALLSRASESCSDPCTATGAPLRSAPPGNRGRREGGVGRPRSSRACCIEVMRCCSERTVAS